MREGRSLVWSIAAPILAAVLVATVFGGLALGLSLMRTIEDGVRREIALDIAAIRQNEERLRVVAIADAIDHRVAAAPATSGGLYLLAGRDGAAITGNLARIPAGAFEDNWIRFAAQTSTGEPANWLGRKEDLPQGFALFVARRADQHWEMARQAAPAVLLVLVASLALVSLILSRTSRGIATAVADLNGVIADARSGASEKRLTTFAAPRELKQLGLQVNALLDTIERQHANMRRLSTQAAHEMRTPLARVVARLRHAPDPAVIAECCQELEETLAVLQALLDIAEHESEPSVATQTLDLAEICSPVCDLYADAAADRTIELRRSLGCALAMGEPSLLTRAVANLLDNALKAGPPGSIVKVATGVESGRAFVSVTDEGSGVGGRSIDQLLTPLRAGSREPGSHGLGLRLTRAIALRHSATLSVAPGATRGSVFTLTFSAVTW